MMPASLAKSTDGDVLCCATGGRTYLDLHTTPLPYSPDRQSLVTKYLHEHRRREPATRQPGRVQADIVDACAAGLTPDARRPAPRPFTPHVVPSPPSSTPQEKEEQKQQQRQDGGGGRDWAWWPFVAVMVRLLGGLIVAETGGMTALACQPDLFKCFRHSSSSASSSSSWGLRSCVQAAALWQRRRWLLMG